ncbi:hypothetical protein [Companilactobacillus jidongensis]|uniref:hypothetical protein n=1 Tax=Companilactobacillus jidongensis TaxID=2486006 RepID=UPI001CDBDD69|nr:hypothetical protein [Companilactobacillus jidongensis]
MIIYKNEKLREKIKNEDLKYWEIANTIGITDSTFSRWLRTPLNDERKQRVLDAISELTKEIKA